MNYDQFHVVWYEILDAAGLLPFPPRTTEIVELGRLSRIYWQCEAP